MKNHLGFLLPSSCHFFRTVATLRRGVAFVALLGLVIAAASSCGSVDNDCSDGVCDDPSYCATRVTCEAMGNDCGTIDDGCGGTLECGMCSGWYTCGGRGVVNVCGADCGAEGCPTTYQCNERGVCAGGTPTGLILDVRTAQVSGRVTLNGSAPNRTCTTTSPATVLFHETIRGYDLSIDVPCTDSFDFAGQIYPGVYEVSVAGTGSGSDLPSRVPFVVNPKLVVSADQTDLALDVKTVAVSGGVLLNGAPPTKTCMTASPATVLFHEVNKNYDLQIDVPCMDSFAWSGQVYPGTYRLSVAGNQYSNLPQGSPFVGNPNLALKAAQSNLVIDVKTVQVTGSVTLNGAPPTKTCMTASPATVLFHEVNKNYDITVAVPCMDSFAFTGQVYPGTYRVSVAGNQYSNLPQGSPFVANANLTLQANQSGVVLDVKTVQASGTITLNGAAPTKTCMSASPATVSFTEVTKGYALTIAVPCMDSFAWSGLLYPGTYRVSVVGNQYSNLPQGSPFVANSSLVLNTNQAGIALDVKTAQVSGTITLNGAAPTKTCMSASPATVTFTEVTKGYALTIAVPCMDGFGWTGQVYPGTYRVSVIGNQYSNLPARAAYIASSALVVGGNKSDIVLDVKTTQVGGKVTLNTAQPMKTCTMSSPATVLFHEVTKNFDLAVDVPCMDAFTFDGMIYPGTYRVSVVGNQYSNLPGRTAYVAIERIEIP